MLVLEIALGVVLGQLVFNGTLALILRARRRNERAELQGLLASLQDLDPSQVPEAV